MTRHEITLQEALLNARKRVELKEKLISLKRQMEKTDTQYRKSKSPFAYDWNGEISSSSIENKERLDSIKDFLDKRVYYLVKAGCTDSQIETFWEKLGATTKDKIIYYLNHDSEEEGEDMAFF